MADDSACCRHGWSKGGKVTFITELKLRVFRLREPFERVCHCEVNMSQMDLRMTPLYSYAHGEQILSMKTLSEKFRSRP